MSKVRNTKAAVNAKSHFISALFMGCNKSRPLTSDSVASTMRPQLKTPSNELVNPDTEIFNPETENEPRVRFDDNEEDSEPEYPDFGELESQSNFGGRLMSANVRSRPSSALFSPSLMMTETVADTESFHSETSVDCRAPSLSLWYDDNVKGDILVQDVYVPINGLTKQTYYCCLQWNSGINGGGYCGIQDHGKGRNYIFSIWDPIGTREKIRPIYVGPGTICEPFGGEGTGLKSWNFDLGWDPDNWYTFVCRRWDQDEHTYYGLWVKHHIEGIWTHLVTVDFPVPETYFETWTCSFLEDWEGTGQNERRVHFKNGYKRQVDETWIPFDKAIFGIVKEFSSRQYADNYDSGSFEETFYLQSGGKTKASQDFTPETVLQKPMLPEPDTLPISCYLNSVTEQEIIWEIPSGSVPQFQYIIKVDGEFYKQGYNSEVRMCRIDVSIDDSVELLIEDLYGKISRLKYLVREGKEVKMRMTKSAKLLLVQKTLLEEEEDFLDEFSDDGATDADTLITGFTTPFRGPSAGTTTIFEDNGGSDDGLSDIVELADQFTIREGARTNATQETAMYPPSPTRRRSGYPSEKGRPRTSVTLETPMYPYSADKQTRHHSRRAKPRTQATSETAVLPSSPGGPSTYATSAKSKARTNITTDTEMYATTDGQQSPYPVSESGKAQTYVTTDTGVLPSSPGGPSTYATSAKSKARTNFITDTELYATTDGQQSPYPVSERGKAQTYVTTDTAMYPSSDGAQSPYPVSESGYAKTYQTRETALYPSSDGAHSPDPGDQSPYPVSESGYAKTYQTRDTALYPSSAGGNLYPASEDGATTMYATSVGDYDTDGETLVGAYAPSDVETTRYFTTEGETTEASERYSYTETDKESSY